MRRLWTFGILAFAIASLAGQQLDPHIASPFPETDFSRVTVYAVGPGTTGPELLPGVPFEVNSGKCDGKRQGKVTLSLIVDANGLPRNLSFIRPVGTDLDKTALEIVESDRFKPGVSDGRPVAIPRSVEVSMQTCVEHAKSSTGLAGSLLRLKSQPTQKFGTAEKAPTEAVLVSRPDSWTDPNHIYKVGGEITAPILLNSPQADYPEEARELRLNGKCSLSMVVDTQGMPQEIQVLSTEGHGFDQKVADVANRYRFKPAMKSSEPVAVRIQIEAAFHTD